MATIGFGSALGLTAVGRFVQSGGTFTPSRIDVGLNFGRAFYDMSGGTLTSQHFEIGLGALSTFAQTAGLVQPGYMNIDINGKYDLSGGTLQLTSSLIPMRGALNFNAGTYTLDVRAGIADLTNAHFNDLSGCTFTSSAQSLTLLPAGFDTTRFAAYTPLGLVHPVGSPLTIPAGSVIKGVGTIPDFLTVAGSLSPAAPSDVNLAIQVPGGVHVTGSGVLDVGNTAITFNDSASTVDGGSLQAKTLYFGKTADCTFNQTGGEITQSGIYGNGVSIYLGYNAGVTGNVTMSGSSIFRATELNVGFNGTGHFVQNGGQVTGVNSSGAYIGVNNAASSYLITAGSILTADVNVTDGTFSQTGGSVQLAMEMDLGESPNSGGTYDLSGGTCNPRNLIIGYNSNTHATFFLHGTGVLGGTTNPSMSVGSQGGGTYRQTAGTATLGAVRVGGVTQNSLLDMQAGTLTAPTLTVAGPTPSQAVYDQTGGTVTIATDAFIGHNGTGGGRVNIHAGQFSVTGTTRIGGYKINSFDTGNGNGALNLSGGTSTFGTLLVGDETFPGVGSLSISDAAASVTVKTALSFGGHASVNFVPGATIHMTGSPYTTHVTNPANLSTMAMMTLVFEGGAAQTDPFEVAGQDRGATPSGYDLNFALGTLQLGGSKVSKLRLVDLFDNQASTTGAEALYVTNLIIGPSSTLDLNGLHLYYTSATIDPTAVVSGGQLTSVPEPTAVASVLFAGAALRRCRRRRSKSE
jgi:hypothetical protein